MIKLFLSTEQNDPVSAIIRWHTTCDWSHAGFIRLENHHTFSAMLDGGVQWRPPNPAARILLLDAPGIDEAFNMALTQEGRPYDFLDILGIAAAKNISQPGAWICDKLVFWAFSQSGHPLVNMTFIPIEHLTPRDILLSQSVVEYKETT